MIRRLPLLLPLVLALGSTPCAARTIAVVLDRSGSMQRADPDQRAAQVLAAALLLAAEPGDRLVVIPTGGSPTSPAPLPENLRERVRALSPLTDAATFAGSADMLAAWDRAQRAAGADGLVVVVTDDDLDVIGSDGQVAPDLLRAAREGGAPPTRDRINAVAAAQLARVGAEAPTLAIRVPLDADVRATPFVEAAGAEALDLGGDPGEVVRALCARLRGAPTVVLERTRWSVPVRAAGLGRAPDGATRVGSGSWVWDAPAGAELPAGAWVRPQLGVPEEVSAYRLGDGRVWVQAPTLELGQLRIVGGATLAGDPLRAELRSEPSPDQVEVERVLGPAGHPDFVAQRTVPVSPAQVVLTVEGEAPTEGAAVQLRGTLPPGLAPEAVRSTSAVVHGPAQQRAAMTVTLNGREVSARWTPTWSGAARVESEGSLELVWAAPMEVGARVSGGEGSGGGVSTGGISRRTKQIISGLVVLSVLLGFWLVRRRVDWQEWHQEWSNQQLRALGSNGRISFEQYRFTDYTAGPGLAMVEAEQQSGCQVWVERLSPSKVKVWVEAPDFDAPPTLMHQLYPGEFTDELELTHGEAFAVIHARKARRYVYLGQDPSAEELTLRYLSDGVSVEEDDDGDEGVFVVLEDGENLAASQSVDASDDLFGSDQDEQ